MPAENERANKEANQGSAKKCFEFRIHIAIFLLKLHSSTATQQIKEGPVKNQRNTIKLGLGDSMFVGKP
jgi:hypothetical protein